MYPTITLIVTRGPLAGRKFAFDEPANCTIGRSRDCTIALSLEPEHLDVSRHHCQLEISASAIQIRDLGSLNGTYVNGRKIGQRLGRETPVNLGPTGPPAFALSDGDEIQLGEHTAFRVCVSPLVRPDTARPRRASSGELPTYR